MPPADALLASRACPEVNSFMPGVTVREIDSTEAKIALSKKIYTVSLNEPYTVTLSKDPCSLSKLTYGTAIPVALIVGRSGRIPL